MRSFKPISCFLPNRHDQQGRRQNRRDRQGVALLAVLVLSAVGLVFVAVGQRHIRAAMSGEQHTMNRDDYQATAMEAMAVAIEKLERRVPTASHYECQVTIDGGSGKLLSFEVTYDLLGGSWEIHVAPLSDGDLPVMPGLLP